MNFKYIVLIMINVSLFEPTVSKRVLQMNAQFEVMTNKLMIITQFRIKPSLFNKQDQHSFLTPLVKENN